MLIAEFWGTSLNSDDKGRENSKVTECCLLIQIMVSELSFIEFLYLFFLPYPPLSKTVPLRNLDDEKIVIASSSCPCGLPVRLISLPVHPPARLARSLLFLKKSYTTKLEAEKGNIFRSKNFGCCCAADHLSLGVLHEESTVLSCMSDPLVSIIDEATPGYVDDDPFYFPDTVSFNG